MEKSTVQVARRDKLVYVQVRGRGSFQNAAHLKGFCDEMLKTGAEDFLIDLKECSYLDSTFLGILAGIGLKLRTAGHGLVEVIHASHRNAELIQNLGLDRLFRFHLKPPEFEGVSLEQLDGPATGRQQTGALMLQAHETLIKWDQQNATKFKDVVAYLREDLGQSVD
ncbi:MAG: STAS domain-containing protein [Verrucomicrobium sp.]|nr:STAS domain-containing protein [Verrucomicrobium sp.]